MMRCIWPECREIYCQECPAGQTGWEDFEENPMTPELQAVFDAAFEREFGPLPSSTRIPAPPDVVR